MTILTGMLVALLAFQESVSQAEDPPLQGVYYYLDTTGKPVELERQVAVQDIKPKALGFSGMKILFKVPGEKSPIRLPRGQKLEFVFLVPPKVDPRSLVEFVRLEPKKGQRELLAVERTAMGTVKDRLNRDQLGYELTKYGPSSFKLTPKAVLPPGEYALSTPNSSTTFCFGIDGGK